jgi:hypothetical protein
VWFLGGGTGSVLLALTWPVHGATLSASGITSKLYTAAPVVLANRALWLVLRVVQCKQDQPPEASNMATCWQQHVWASPGQEAAGWEHTSWWYWGLLVLLIAAVQVADWHQQRSSQESEQRRQRRAEARSRRGQQPHPQSSAFRHGFGPCMLVPGCTGVVRQVLLAEDYYEVGG